MFLLIIQNVVFYDHVKNTYVHTLEYLIKVRYLINVRGITEDFLGIT